jgi:hypothetical protein
MEVQSKISNLSLKVAESTELIFNNFYRFKQEEEDEMMEWLGSMEDEINSMTAKQEMLQKLCLNKLSGAEVELRKHYNEHNPEVNIFKMWAEDRKTKEKMFLERWNIRDN